MTTPAASAHAGRALAGSEFKRWQEAEGRALHARLLAAGDHVAAAESLTAGRVQTELARRSGASAYFLGGCTCYTTDVKVHLLGIDREHAARVNAVSAHVALEMAGGVARRFGANVAVATTGYAEAAPERGVPHPFAWIAVVRNGVSRVQRVDGPGLGREAMQDYVTAQALRLIAAVLNLPV